MKSYFDRNGYPMPLQMNPAEFVLDLVNTDFAIDSEAARTKLLDIQQRWVDSAEYASTQEAIKATTSAMEKLDLRLEERKRANGFSMVLTLLHRAFIKSYRDVVAYGVRIAMYLGKRCFLFTYVGLYLLTFPGLAIMTGTVWLRLGGPQEDIQPLINALVRDIFPFNGIQSSNAIGSSLAQHSCPSWRWLMFPRFSKTAQFSSRNEQMAFMARPPSSYPTSSSAFHIYVRASPLQLVRNSTRADILLPVIITILFSVVAYWLVNFRSGADAFFNFVMWVFLDLVAAESLVVLVSSVVPNFVVALALTAFLNGLWMSVGGFMVSPTILNVFWKYVFHYIDYQAYVFQGMMVNEFEKRVFDCGSDCHCMYQSELAPECKIAGTGVLESFGYATGRRGKWVGILIGIIAVYRLFGWIALLIRKR